MPRAKKPITAAECVDPYAAVAAAANASIQAIQQPVLDALQSIQADDQPLVTLKYSPEDMEKLDQFAIGLLRDGSASFESTNIAFQQRVRDAYLRAEVMLTIRKEIAALEAI